MPVRESRRFAKSLIGADKRHLLTQTLVEKTHDPLARRNVRRAWHGHRFRHQRDHGQIRRADQAFSIPVHFQRLPPNRSSASSFAISRSYWHTPKNLPTKTSPSFPRRAQRAHPKNRRQPCVRMRPPRFARQSRPPRPRTHADDQTKRMPIAWVGQENMHFPHPAHNRGSAACA